MNYRTFIILLYILNELIIKIKTQSSTISLKFKRYFSQQNNDFILSNFNNDIYISLKIGYPRQNIEKVFLKSDTYELMISNSTSYNNKNSDSSELISYPQYYQVKYTLKAYIIKDSFYILDNDDNEKYSKYQEINFLYATNINNKIYTSVIGFELTEDGVKKSQPLICQLKDLNYIKDTTWTLKYTSEDEGMIYMGDVLNNEVYNGFKMEEYRKTNAVIFGRYLSWDLLFSQIEFNDIKISGSLQANLDFGFGLISCSKEYYNTIKKEFFNEYITKGKCQELLYNKDNNNIINLNSKFNYIVCEKGFNIKKFPEISFYHTELDFEFKLTSKDLFISSNGKIYFLCINEIISNNRWIFGKPFFKKYKIIFDYNSKTIGIYNDEYSNNSINWIIVFEWFIVIILIIVFIILVYTLVRRYRLNHYKTLEKIIKVDELGNTFFEENFTKLNIKNLQQINEKNKIIEDN